MVKIKAPQKISGEMSVPGDKSISHRGLILASMAEGKSELTGLSPGKDVQATLRIFQQLGVDIKSIKENKFVIQGKGSGGFKTPNGILDCENSGTSARLLTGFNL